jgi:myxalamid-type polyketide synthase MxaE and MxaD
MPPLRGVIHAAGVLADDFLVQQDWPRFAGVLAAKVSGAWNLHLTTLNRPLDFFVLFSSAAALAGSPGQGNHAAANAFLDALAHYRRGLGLPASSINWGAWAEVGAAAERKADARVALRGMGSIAPQQGLQVLGHIMSEDYTQVGVMPIDWRQLGSQVESSLLADLIRNEVGAESETEQSTLSARTLLAADASDRPRMLEVYLCEQIARVMRLSDASKLDVRQPINTLGIDSLMAIELRTRVQKDLGVVAPIADVLQGPSIAQLAALLLQQLSVGRLLDVTHVKAAAAADDENWEVLKL